MAHEKKAKKHLVSVEHHKAKGGGFIHEHHMEDEDGNKSSHFAGFSPGVEDVQQHDMDHLGPGADDAGEPQDSGAEAPPAGGGAPPGPGGATPPQA